jgi:hypothetical protein
MLDNDDDVQAYFVSAFAADPSHPAFVLANDNPKNWRAAMQDRDSSTWHANSL